MKKVFLSLAVLASVAMVSCKKNADAAAEATTDSVAADSTVEVVDSAVVDSAAVEVVDSAAVAE